MASWVFNQASDEEGLRLIVAFLQLQDPAVRASLIEYVESLAAEASVQIATNRPSLPQDNRPR